MLSNQSLDLDEGFSKHFEGRINGRPAVLEIFKTGIYNINPFFAHFYYIDEKRPYLLKGNYMPQNTGKTRIYIGSNSQINKLDAIEKDSIKLSDYYSNICGNNTAVFKGVFASKDTFKGIFLDCYNQPTEFEFVEKKKVDYNILFKTTSYASKIKIPSNGKKYNAFLNIEMLLPEINSNLSLFIKKSIYEIVSPDRDIFMDINKDIKDYLSRSESKFFIYDKKILKKAPNEESYQDYIICSAYQYKNLLSILKIHKFDVARKQGCYTQGYSYDLQKSKRIRFGDIFKSKDKNKIFKLIKEKYRTVTIQLSQFNENNFYLTHAGVVFITFSHSDSHEQKITGTQFFLTFDELKDITDSEFRI